MPSARVGIDFHVAGGIYQGVRTYLTNLIAEVLKGKSEFDYVVYTPSREECRRWQTPQSKVDIKDLPSPWSYFNLLFGFAGCAIRDGLALFHSQYVLPVFLPCKSVLTIHDILFESHPEFFPKFHGQLMKLFVPYSAKRAESIISVSEFTKQEICKYYGVPEDKITVTYEGASAGFRPTRDKDLISSKLKEYGIEAKYLLFVGRIEPRKNITSVLKAFEYLKKKGYKELDLVIVGNQDRLFKEKMLFSEIKARGLQSDVIFTGGVSEQDLCILYSGAEALAYPAFAEGFGLPVVEAMACGTPVITSNTTALGEVAGDAAILVNPNSVAEIARALERILGDKTLKTMLSLRGLDRSENFRWRKTAHETIEVYRRVVGG